MTDKKVYEIFRMLIERFGQDEVARRLTFLVERADDFLLCRRASTVGVNSAESNAKTKTKSATEQVDGMVLPNDRKGQLQELAKRFDNKSFLPTIGDIRNLLYTYGAEPSSIKSRQSSIPKIFTFLSAIPKDQLANIINDHSFSGPSSLAPLSKAIKSRGNDRRRATKTEPPAFDDEQLKPLGDDKKN